MLDQLRQHVLEANRELVDRGLVTGTFGNASGLDRATGRVVIKPSGQPYDGMTTAQLVVLSLETGEVLEGDLRPSSDTPTHLALYRAFEHIGGVVHTHSLYATAWSQARREIPVLGTTHADHFHGPIPCTRPLRPGEIQARYEANTGKVIAEHFARMDPQRMPGVLVADHGPFTWGDSPAAAVEHAALLEHIAHLAHLTVNIEPYPKLISPELLDRHFLRKHGPGATYGQS